MAITNTRRVQRVEVYPALDADSEPTVMVCYEHTFDDSEDDQLPVTSVMVKHLYRYTTSVNEEGETVNTANVHTGEDQLVQDICAAIWTD